MNTQRTRFDWSTTLRIPALLASTMLAGIAHADNPAPLAAHVAGMTVSGTAGANAEQRMRAELRAVMTELIQTGAFEGQPAQSISMDIDSPAQRVSDLGLLVDSAHESRDGLRVLAVTPGGSAERIGLQAGDILVALNASSLEGAGSAAILRHAVDALPDGSTLAFQVRRNGSLQKVSGPLAAVYLPAMHLTVGDGVQVASAHRAAATAAQPGAAQGCGRISDFDAAPRQQDLHAAKIISIDGKTPGPSTSKSFRVEAGTHEVKVAEQIESRYLSFNDRLRNSGLAGDQYKTLSVDVAPDTTTLIAARLNKDRRTEWKNGAYWGPVAWKQIAEGCR